MRAFDVFECEVKPAARSKKCRFDMQKTLLCAPIRLGKKSAVKAHERFFVLGFFFTNGGQHHWIHLRFSRGHSPRVDQ